MDRDWYELTRDRMTRSRAGRRKRVTCPAATSSGSSSSSWRTLLTQVSAATKALRAFSLELLGEHLSTYAMQAAAAGGTEADEKVREACAAVARLVRSRSTTTRAAGASGSWS